MKATLQSLNYPDINKHLIFIQRKDEILITTDDGKEIGSLVVEIMDKTVQNDLGKFDTVASNSFWLTFRPQQALTQKNSADVYLEE